MVVQVKRYINSVGVKAVQEIFTGMRHYNINRGMVVTSAERYTNQAMKLAKSCEVELWTLNDLVYHVKHINGEEIACKK